MTRFQSINCSDHVFRVRVWTKTVPTDNGDTITYQLSPKPTVHLESHLINVDEGSLRSLVESQLPKRGNAEVLDMMFEATYRACLLEDPYEAASQFKSRPYEVKENQIIIPKSHHAGYGRVRPAFFLRRDVREYEEGMSENEIRLLFESDEKSVPDLEFTSALFVASR